MMVRALVSTLLLAFFGCDGRTEASRPSSGERSFTPSPPLERARVGSMSWPSDGGVNTGSRTPPR